MKKILSLLALFFLFNSCSLDDGNDTNYLFEILPITTVDIPTEFTLGQTYPITVRYNKPTSCHLFNTLYYEKNLNIRTIAVESAVRQTDDCQDFIAPTGDSEHTFNFQVTSNGSYIFKFYQGKDANGVNTYLEYEVPVTN